MFSIKAEDGAARAGVLSTPHGNIETPAWLVYTRRGGALHLTPDLLEGLRPQAVQLDVLHFLSQPDPKVLAGFSGSGREFLGLPPSGCVVVATGRDPTTYEYIGALRQATDQWASITNHAGGGAVSPTQYMAAVSALQPDVFVALSDDVPCDSKRDRAVASVDRSVAWLRECVQLRSTDAGLQRSMLFAAVQGAQFLPERQRCIEAVAMEPAAAGFAIGGLGTGESPDLRRQILQQAAQGLPAGKPRLVLGVGTPEEVLEAVQQGADLFDMGYLVEVTAQGYALCFPLEEEQEEQQQPAATSSRAAAAAGVAAAAGAAGAAAAAAAKGAGDGGGCGRSSAGSGGGDDTKLNLWGLEHRTDARPLLAGCGCYTCRSHSRAYLHHLLHAHEMLAQTLLEVHNSHHYARWFVALRAAVAGERLQQYCDWFLGRRRRAMMG